MNREESLQFDAMNREESLQFDAMNREELLQFDAMNREELNKLTIIEKSCHGLFVLMFCLSIIFNYACVAQLMDVNITENNILNRAMFVIETVINVANSIVIIINLYFNYRDRNYFRLKQMGHKTMLFLICIPTGVFSITCLTILIVSQFNPDENIFEEIAHASSKFVTLVVFIIFLIHVNSRYDFGEKWQLNLFNMLSIEMTIVNLLSRLLSNLAKDQIIVFMKQLQLSSDNCCIILNTDSVQFSMWIMFDMLSSFFYKFEFINCVASIALLIEPLRQHYFFVQRHKARSELPDVPDVCTCNKRHYSVPAIILSSLVVVATVAIKIITWHSELENKAIRIMMTIMYIFEIINIYYLYSDLSKCSVKPNTAFVFSFFLWLGTFGQFVQISYEIQHSIHSMIKEQPVPINLFIIMEYLIVFCQCFFQNFVISLIKERNILRFHHSSLLDLLSSPVYLFVINILLCFLTSFIINAPLDPLSTMFVSTKLFENGFLLVGGIFTMLHRGYAAITLFDYFK